MNDYNSKFTESYQRLIVTAALQDSTFLAHTRESLDSKYFTSMDDQEVVRLVLKHYDEVLAPPAKVELEQSMSSRAKTLGWSDSATSSMMGVIGLLYDSKALGQTSVEKLRDEVATFGRLQALKTAVMDSISTIQEVEAGSDSGSLEAVESNIRNALMVGACKNLGVDMFDFLERPKSIVEGNALSSTDKRVVSGYPTMDSVLEGGLGGGEVGFVMAPSNRGKSMVLANMAAAAFSQGKRCVYFSFEMKEPEIAARIASRLLNSTPEQPSTPTVNEIKTQSQKYLGIAKQVVQHFRSVGGEARVVYIKPSEATPNNLRAVLMNIEATEGWRPDVVYVDYLDEMTLPAGSQIKGDDSYNKFGQIASDLLSIAVDFQCPLWSASQVNREGYNQEPSLETIGRSMQKIDKAEFVVTIIQSEAQKKQNKMQLKILKNRRGPGRGLYIPCVADLTRATISETSA